MKKFLIIVFSAVIVLAIGAYFLLPILFSNPNVTIAKAFQQTFSTNSGSIGCDIKLASQDSTTDTTLNVAFSRSADSKTGQAYATGNTTVLGTPISVEGWFNWDASDISKNTAIFSIPLLSDQYYVTDFNPTSASSDATPALTDAQQKAITNSLVKNFPILKWNKKGNTYSTTITTDILITFYKNVLTDLSADSNFADYKDTFTNALNSTNDIQSTLGTQNIDVSILLANNKVSTLTITGDNVSIPTANASVESPIVPVSTDDGSGITPIDNRSPDPSVIPTDTSAANSTGDTSSNVTITIDFTKMGTAETITLPTVDSTNSQYLGDNSPVIVYIDNQKADFTGYVEGYTLMLPARNVINALGGTMTYVQNPDNTFIITGTIGSNTITLEQNSTAATVNGNSQTLDVPVTNVDGTLYVPARFIVESAGKTITAQKNARGQTLVYITTN